MRERDGVDIDRAWHNFMLRKVLLTHQSICFDFYGINDAVHHPIIRNTVASLLYINLVSILDDAIQERMIPDEYKRGKKTKNRLEMLEKAGDLVNFDALIMINRRRNDFAHEWNQESSVQELEQAIERVQEQLQTWGLMIDRGEYELTFERTAARDSSQPGVLFEQDKIIRIQAGDKIVFELKQTSAYSKEHD